MNAIGIIVISTAVSGALDILATSTMARSQGIPMQRLLQFISSGALGPSAFEGRNRTATLGLVFHFCIAFSAAAIYFVTGSHLPVLFRHPWPCGALYGVLVHLAMSRIVIPLSRTAPRPFDRKAFLAQLAIHILCVGIPIAVTQHFLLS